MKKTSKISNTVRRGSSWWEAFKYLHAIADPGTRFERAARFEREAERALTNSGNDELIGEGVGDPELISAATI